jgi:hypothetical protein
VKSEQLKFYKRIFKNALEPILVMLINRKRSMTKEIWDDSIAIIEDRVINNPTEFLGFDLPAKRSMTKIIRTIFKQFVKKKKSQ